MEEEKNRVGVVILAAGQGTRMKSNTPKVLHRLAGLPMIQNVLNAVAPLRPAQRVMVVGHEGEHVRRVVCSSNNVDMVFVEQEPQLGTGHAVMQARPVLEEKCDLVVVLYGDMPLVMPDTLHRLVDEHVGQDAVITLLTGVVDEPGSYGRVVRGEDGELLAIVEAADCTARQLAINEINTGMYCFSAGWLWEHLPEIKVSPKGEYYLTDLLEIALKDGRRAASVEVAEIIEAMGINNREQLAEAEAVLRARINRYWMAQGVTMRDPAATYVDYMVRIGRDTVIYPNAHLMGRTVVGERCVVGPCVVLRDANLPDDTEVWE